MKRFLLCGAAILSLSACTTFGSTSANDLEQADTAAASAYAATAIVLNAYEQASPNNVANGELLKGKAWGYYQAENKLYKSSGANLQQLQMLIMQIQAIEFEAKTLINPPT